MACPPPGLETLDCPLLATVACPPSLSCDPDVTLASPLFFLEPPASACAIAMPSAEGSDVASEACLLLFLPPVPLFSDTEEGGVPLEQVGYAAGVARPSEESLPAAFAVRL